MRHGTSAWLCLILLARCIQPAIATAPIKNAMVAAEVDALSQGAEALHQGDRVRYQVRHSDRGPQADRVERVSGR